LALTQTDFENDLAKCQVPSVNAELCA